MTEVIGRRDLGRNLNNITPQLTANKSNDDVDYTDYRFEIARLHSYTNWPVSFIDPKKLAAAGFYYTGNSDIVRCFECQLTLRNWKESDDVWTDHQRWCGKCRFIRDIPCGNVPIDTDPNTIPPYTKLRDVCGVYGMKVCPNAVPDQSVNVLFAESRVPSVAKVSTIQSSQYPEYSNEEDRLRSFNTWPVTKSQTKEAMAAAGFFYNGESDRTTCYYCGGGLEGWEPQDVPVHEHIKWFPKCAFAIRTLQNITEPSHM